MPLVTIYTKPFCPYCIRAIALLKKKGVAFTAAAPSLTHSQVQSNSSQSDASRLRLNS